MNPHNEMDVVWQDTAPCKAPCKPSSNLRGVSQLVCLPSLPYSRYLSDPEARLLLSFDETRVAATGRRSAAGRRSGLMSLPLQGQGWCSGALPKPHRTQVPLSHVRRLLPHGALPGPGVRQVH